jgi:hypothetical protein
MPPQDADEVRGLRMKTYPIKDATGKLVAVEVDMVFCPLRDLVRTIAAAEGVTEAKARRPFSSVGDIRATFRFHGDEFAVVEPFGDNSRYWIGPVSDSKKPDISQIESQLRSYAPSIFRRIFGAVLSLDFRAVMDQK